MNILVTGGAGFIGSHIVDTYIENNHNVVIIDDMSKGRKEFINPKATFHKVSISDPRLANILKNEKIQVINHHAAQISVSDSVKNPVNDAKSNIIGTLQLLQNAVECGVKTFIFASTGGAIYGEQDYFPAREDHPKKPTSPYGLSKLSVEGYLRFYKQQYGLKTIIFRYGNVFGPRQNPNSEAGVIAIFFNRLLKGCSPIINGDGEQTRDYIFIRDVVQANLLALALKKSDIFNVGTGEETSVNELTRLILQVAESKINAETSKKNNFEQRRSCLDYKKIKRSLNWTPKVPLKEGLTETYSFFKENDI
ncbi:MAG: NAD-dependent epimerase/dehydratase family protein [Nitrospina sp.]|jgi:UDP-glucose 4-epimerase|nr:NAD-dependent epimerase/dehydratase family protein [Nitrospina sp.]MBT6601655.1 NAD-dependent epimerase/dehydratase family protein [Nitrospina sp.]